MALISRFLCLHSIYWRSDILFGCLLTSSAIDQEASQQRGTVWHGRADRSTFGEVFLFLVCHKTQFRHDAPSIYIQQGTTYTFSEWNTFNYAPKINAMQFIKGAGSIRITNRLIGRRTDEDQDPVSQKHLSAGIISLHWTQLKWSKQ